ncbi:tRNA (adenosine(37)-N6)-threonylcarbamoyltransferase complex ATPase subunit type 1 TsaE [Ferviditalea candida]|uniref:tRNA threonylcarbamoyladenosine biosynthesis protein TsaE n=1 Tax=Ferviditalea candida TaxID=3108399 RepID=A0ABU5ZEI0_9BACL|nr:tRNA (adenosine(37)-N6)-threonylcarbamoyltransferase complex ATPase subunit type 1 TsaE [Paenibacillaceae bacterium T2]
MSDIQTEYQFASRSLEDTRRLAEAIAKFAKAGSVIALEGDLGAGKTAFSQFFASALGVRDTVNSPTFTLIKEYQGRELPLYHMDVYRVTANEAGELGLDEYFYGEGVTLVEWASRLEDLLPDTRLSLYIEYVAGQARTFRIEPFGRPYTGWCEEMKRMGVIK